MIYLLFLFYDPSSHEIYTLSLHDALPISWSKAMEATEFLNEQDPTPYEVVAALDRTHRLVGSGIWELPFGRDRARRPPRTGSDRKSTRLNSSHSQISYAVFCLKKKKTLTQ